MYVGEHIDSVTPSSQPLQDDVSGIGMMIAVSNERAFHE